MTQADPAPPAPGPYLQTVSGRWVNPFDPDPSQLDAGDIARALANQCRFGGHSRVFYSVAQHSVIVSELVEARGGDAEDCFAALMHDAAEAYLGDMPHPIKHRSALGAAFKAAEEHLEQAIRDRFRIREDVPAIKRADRALLATERRAFSAESWHWPELEGVEPLDLEIVPVPPDEAAAAFAARYAELDARRRAPTGGTVGAVVAGPAVRLRQVVPSELPIHFEQQRDPESSRLAAVTPRDRAAFDAHWKAILADPDIVARTIVCGDEVVGNAVAFPRDGRRHVGYWVARERWGEGIASAALPLLLAELSERPLFATVAVHNAASLRVLEKVGFRRCGQEQQDDALLHVLRLE